MNINDLIKTTYRNLNETEKDVLKYMLSHSKKLKEMKIQDVAKATFTQPNTIIRMSKKLGYSGFSEMKHALFHHLESPIQLVKEVQNDLYHDLMQTKTLIHEQQLDEVAKKMINAQHISIFGIGASRFSADVFSTRLSFLGMSSSTFIDQHAMFFYTNRLSKQDVCLMISYSGQQQGIIAPALLAKSRGALVISLTGVSDNELARIADIRLFFQSTPLSFNGADLTSRLPADMVLDALFHAIMKQIDV